MPIAVLQPPCPPTTSLHASQRQDKDLAAIKSYLETSHLPLNDSQARSLLLNIDPLKKEVSFAIGGPQ